MHDAPAPKGVHPKVVADVLGHDSVTLTLDTYSHALPGLGDAAEEAIDVALGRRVTVRL